MTTYLIAPVVKKATATLLSAAGRRLGRLLQAPERAAALERSTEAGILAMVQAAPVDERVHLTEVLEEFFTSEEIRDDRTTALVPLLRGQPLDLDEVEELFRAEKDAATLTDVDVRAGFRAFAAGFAAAVVEQPVLREELKARVLLEQLGIQAEMRDSLKEVASFLAASRPGTVGVSGGQITAQNVAGTQVFVFQDGTATVERRPDDPEDPVRPLREAYLHRVMESAGYLALGGIDPAVAPGQADASLRLDAIYTALLTSSPWEHDKEKMERGEEGHASALEELNRHQRLVLLGDPGSGKSTFVNFVALCQAGEQLGSPRANHALLTAPLGTAGDDENEEPQPWNHAALLPVRVVLRDFAARALPEPGKPCSADCLWGFLEQELQDAALGDFAPHLKEALQRNGGLILLDGLDEVPEAEGRRGQILEAIRDFAVTFGRCRFLVTCRTYAYQHQGWRLPGFTEIVLRPLAEDQIESFVDRWYAHMAEIRGLETGDAQGRAELLKSAIRTNERLRPLAERPLLLTLMASLHAWRGGSLPEEREELYHDAVRLLLDFWEQRRVVFDAAGRPVVQQESLTEWLQVDRARVRRLLNEIAYRAHAAQEGVEGTADIDERELVMGLIDDDPDVRPGRLVEFLRDRAGLLLPRGVGVYTFSHRIFQEYLAACHLLDYNFPEELARLGRSDKERWREVVLLAGAKAARGSPALPWHLADALCFRDVDDEECSEADFHGAYLAGAVLVETSAIGSLHEKQLDQDRFTIIVDRVRSWLTSALDETEPLAASEKVEYRRLLAKLGETGQVLAEVAASAARGVAALPALRKFVELVPWAAALNRRCELDGTRVVAVRAIGAGRWLLRARLPPSLQEAYETAPEALILAVEGEVQGEDLERAYDELRRHEFSLDLDLLIVVDDRPHLARRLDRMFRQGGQWVAWSFTESGFPSLTTAFRDYLPKQDVFERREAVRGLQVIGRTEIISDLSHRLIAGQAVGVFGLRKVGKTTVVRAITDRLDPVSAQSSLSLAKKSDVENPLAVRALVAWLDAGRAHDRNLDALALWLRRALERRLAAENIFLPSGTRSESELAKLDQLLAAVLLSSKLPVIIVLDEYDLLFESSGGEPGVANLGRLFQVLRAHSQETSRLVLVVIGRDPTFFEHPEMGGRTNPMLGWFVPRWLGPMPRPEADLLLTKLGRRVALDTGPETQELGFQWTGGHPLLHRLFGSSLLERSRFEAAGSESHTATDAFCDRAIDIFLERHDVMTICREVFHLLSARYPEAHQLLGELSCEADDDAVEVIAVAGGWHRPAARVLRDFGLLLGTATAPWIPGILRWYLTNFESWQRRRA